MAQIMALDYGIKRIGIAVTDDLQIIASGLATVNTTDIFTFLENYLANENVELFIVGEPKQMDNSPSESEVFILPFIEKLKAKFKNTPVKRVDERFTSKMAFQTMIEGGLGKKQRKNKGLIDKISATIILQTYLERK